MSIGNGNIVQASMNEFNDTKGGQTGDQTGKEIYTRSYYNYVPGGWDYVLRYPGAVSYTHLDVYKRQGYDSLCCKRDYSSNGKT